jgi:glycerol-3-phosphate dehydrogenase
MIKFLEWRIGMYNKVSTDLNFVEREKKVQKFWEENKIFEESIEERKELVEKNPLYGRVICRCEMVTEGEIVDAINRPLGAKNLDAVKRRTRAGMGRCQGGFCSPRVVEILSRELGVEPTDITKFGGNS